MSFLRDVAEAGPLQPLYGIGGERELVEQHLDHLDGFCGSRPVRIGNAAYFQRQHDLMGEMILCLDTIDARSAGRHRRHRAASPAGRAVRREAMIAVESDDTGLWEYRTLAEQIHVLARAVLGRRQPRRQARAPPRTRIARHRVGAWADAYREDILARAYNEELGFFTQVLDGRFPDASNLLLPTLGIIDPRDPRFVSTLEAYERLLVDRRADVALPSQGRFRRHDERLFDLLVLVGRSARHGRAPGRCRASCSTGCMSSREWRRAVFGRHRAANRHAARQLSAGLYARGPDQHRGDDQRAHRSAGCEVPCVELTASWPRGKRGPTTHAHSF